MRLCDEAISAYLQKRGKAVFDHRRAALGYLSGSLRYGVLKRAGFRCELCGISADERAIEVDHIIPRKHGGEDDSTNLQALCFKCNANKGARDDADCHQHGRSFRQARKIAIMCLKFGVHPGNPGLTVFLGAPAGVFGPIANARQHAYCRLG